MVNGRIEVIERQRLAATDETEYRNRAEKQRITESLTEHSPGSCAIESPTVVPELL